MLRKIISILLPAAFCFAATASADSVQEISKVTDYLFEITCDDYEQYIDVANEYYTVYNPKLGGCSSIQNGIYRGRNYDWTYDEEPEFVIHVPANESGRHASIGMAATTLMTAADVENGTGEEWIFNMLPYITLDGINDAGLTVNINVVGYEEMGEYDMKTSDTADDVCPLMVPRLLLDNAGSIDEALEMMAEMDIFSLSTLEEAHYMITGPQSPEDSTVNTVVVELIPNEDKHYELSVIDFNKGDFVDNKAIMTNFHLTGFDGTVESATRHPMGYERYEILSENYDQGSSVRGMLDLMKKVYFSLAYDLYSDHFWYSDYAGGELDMTNIGADNLQGDLSAAGVYADVIGGAMECYNNMQRDSTVWHTVHTSVYDTQNKMMYVMPQESGFAYEYSLEG